MLSLRLWPGIRGSLVTSEQVQEARSYNLLQLLPADARLIQKGKGWYMLNCTMPGHEDPNPSMSLRKYPDGQWRYKCFGCGQSGDPVQYLVATQGVNFMDAVQQLSSKSKTAPTRPKQVAEYDYYDESGTLLYQVIRYEPKDFRVRQPHIEGGCIWNLQGVRRVLYRLPIIRSIGEFEPRRDLYYVEGEKDVHTLETKGLAATTHAGGASSWRDELMDQIPKSYRLILVPDMDDPGKQLMRRIWNVAMNQGRQVQFILLPPVRGQDGVYSNPKDVSDFFDLGGTVEELKGAIT